MINTVIEDFDYGDEGNKTQSDEDDGEDDLDYSGGLPESLVCRTPLTTVNTDTIL